MAERSQGKAKFLGGDVEFGGESWLHAYVMHITDAFDVH
jgi:hypothetical protein